MTALNPKSGIKTTTEEICKTDYKGKQIIPKKITETFTFSDIFIVTSTE